MHISKEKFKILILAAWTKIKPAIIYTFIAAVNPFTFQPQLTPTLLPNGL